MPPVANCASYTVKKAQFVTVKGIKQKTCHFAQQAFLLPLSVQDQSLIERIQRILQGGIEGNIMQEPSQIEHIVHFR